MPEYSLAELAETIGVELIGDASMRINTIAAVDDVSSGGVCFVKASKYLEPALASKASAILIAKDILPQSATRNFLVANNVEVAFVKLANMFAKQKPKLSGIHPSAVVHASANVCDSAYIGPNVVIGQDCNIGSGTHIKAGSVLADNISIGENTLIYANVSLYDDVQIGSDCIIHSGAVIGSDGFGNVNENGRWLKIPQLGSVVIGNDVEVGANVTIDRGALQDTKVADGVRLDNQIHLGHNVIIKQGTAMAGGTIVAGSSTIGAHCMIGGGCCITGHIKITDGVMIAGMSGVTKCIKQPGVYSSAHSVQPSQQWRKSFVHYRNLDKIVKRIRKLEQDK
jgi:UDP-3-O-[3-hydroxymyristoyl] glucosamine N-acyltransferase